MFKTRIESLSEISLSLSIKVLCVSVVWKLATSQHMSWPCYKNQTSISFYRIVMFKKKNKNKKLLKM